MDNASKGLLMAGGMLMAIIVISVLIITFRNTSQIEQANQEAQEAQEIRKFNQGFASYEKSAMYGTDIISVINMAISNNKKYDVEDKPGEDYYVDIIFTLKKDIKDSIYVYEYDNNKWTKSSTDYSNPETERDTDALKQDTEYSLSNYLDELINFVSHADEPDTSTRVLKMEKKMVTKYEEITYGMANFKRSTFRCIDVKYDLNGRIRCMEFKEVK